MKEFPIITEITPEVLHGAMDQHAEYLGIAFGDWLSLNYQPHAEHGYWIDHHNNNHMPQSTKYIYKLFINELLCKSVSQDVSANSTQKPESL